MFRGRRTLWNTLTAGGRKRGDGEESSCISLVQDPTLTSHTAGTRRPLWSWFCYRQKKKKNPALTQLARFLLLSYIYAPGYNRDVHRQRRVHTQALCGRKKRLMIIYGAFILSCVTRERIKPQKRGTSININICKKEICTVIVRHNPSISEPADTNTTPIERTIICCFNSQRIAENTICSVLREQRLWD